jgi:hypothetical protein
MVPGINATGIDNSDPATPRSDGWGYSASQQDTALDMEKIHADAIGGDDEPEQSTISHVDDRQLIQLQQAAVQQATNYLSTLKEAWDRSYRAYRNEHFAGSKYNSEAFKGRSKTFRPKTRSAVRKSMAATAKALFSTGDVVSIAPENDSDQNQTISASLHQELINYRLSRLARRNGIPWFQTAMGARFNSLLTGICASKQQWLYKEKSTRDEDGR